VYADSGLVGTVTAADLAEFRAALQTVARVAANVAAKGAKSRSGGG
jgi:hypothetical protein